MKNLFLLVFTLFVCSATLKAQTYFEPNDCWTEATISDAGGNVIRTFQYFVDNDTLIHGILYKKIVSRYPEDIDQHNYMGSVRVDSKKVFANVIIGTDTIEDVLLYDFSVEIGDTVFGIPPSNTANLFSELTMPKIVTAIDSITLINGEKRKRLFFDCVDPWIEGMGSIQGLFSPAYPITTSFSTFQFVSCFMQHNVEVYQNNTWCSEDCCSLLTMLSDVSGDENASSRLYPIITKDYVRLEPNDLATSFEIRDMFGRCLEVTTDISMDEYRLDLSRYLTGIYLVIIHAKNGTETYKVVKI